MARLSALVTLLLAAAVPLAQAAKPVDVDVKSGRSHVPGAYIFELEDGKDTASLESLVGKEGKTRLNLDYKLFKGVSVQLEDVENAQAKAAKIASSPVVKNYWPVELYGIPKPIVHSVASAKGNPSSSSSIRKRSNDTDGYAPHVMTQVDKLHKEGIKGKGIKIAIVDTGIDYKHPVLGGCFGEGCLTTFGTDLVGDNYTGYNKPVPDDDPMDCQGHGTHVAGIVAAQANEYGFIGGAPEATLGSYRVFGCDGEAANDVLIAAFNQAYEDGADIITASIGGPSGWIDEPWAKAVTNIVNQGVPCTISAGNSGTLGLFYASTASDGLDVASIASFDNIESPTIQYVSSYTIEGGDSEEFGYSPATPSDWDGVKLPLWTPDFDTTIPDGGCDAYPEDTPDLSKYIVLVRRGTCTYVQKAQNAAKFGAKYLMIYNNVAGAVEFDVSSVDGIVAAGMVVPEVGVKWVEALKDKKEVVLDMVGTDDAEWTIIYPKNTRSGGALSYYTSWGPNWDLEEVKPSFGAPGGNILSTYPLAKGGYAVLSGTSMACPLAAAAYALISEVRGSLDPTELRTAVSANGNPQVFNDGAEFYEFFAPVSQQGAGILQAYDAAHAKTVLEPSSFSLGDSATFHSYVNFTISNNGKEEVSYQFSNVPAITMYTLEPDSIYPAAFPNEAVDNAAKLSFSNNKISLGAGESVFIGVKATPPSGLDKNRLPVWSGWIAVNGSDGTSLSLPYEGVSGDLSKHMVLDSSDAWIANSTDENYTPLPANTTFVLPHPGDEADADAVLPALVALLALGSTTLRADLVPQFETKNKKKNFWVDNSIGQPDGFPKQYVGRYINPGSWTGQLEDGNFAAPGSYKVVFNALKIRGDPKKKSDWNSATSPAFTIRYA